MATNYTTLLSISSSSVYFRSYLAKLIAGQAEGIAYIANLSSTDNTEGISGSELVDVIDTVDITLTVTDNIATITTNVTAITDTTLNQLALVTGGVDFENGEVVALIDIPELEVKTGVTVEVSVQMIIQ